MVHTSKHKKQNQEELKKSQCKIKLSKYSFTPDFAADLHAFSEEHHEDHFKVFNKALEEWSTTHKPNIEKEIENIFGMGFTGTKEDIMDKIKISARFYYRKKSKLAARQESQTQSKKKEKKPYIGLSKSFIIKIDEYIKTELISKSDFNRKAAFETFTESHLEDITKELSVLKAKYDEEKEAYAPVEIATKFKKAFENRYYTYFSVVREQMK